MDHTRQATPHTVEGGVAAAAPPGRAAPALDLDRLVWDPEYREAMRPWLAGER